MHVREHASTARFGTATAAKIKASAPSANAVETTSFFVTGFFIAPLSPAICETILARAKLRRDAKT
jgi:hypothetical protein